MHRATEDAAWRRLSGSGKRWRVLPGGALDCGPVARGRRRSLGVLFVVLAVGFAGIALVAARAGGQAWVIAVAAGVLAAWMGELAFRTLR